MPLDWATHGHSRDLEPDEKRPIDGFVLHLGTIRKQCCHMRRGHGRLTVIPACLFLYESGKIIAEKPSADCADLVIPAHRFDPWVKRKNENGVGRVLYATVAYRHSRMLLAGIQTSGTSGLPCGWIPAGSMRE